METSGEAICGPQCSFITHQDLETMETSRLFTHHDLETMETSGFFHYSPGFRDNGDLGALSLLTMI